MTLIYIMALGFLCGPLRHATSKTTQPAKPDTSLYYITY